MKKIFKNLVCIAALAFVVISCDEDETTFNTLNYPADTFVALNGGDIVVLESTTEPVVIQVNYSNSTAGHTSDVSVAFEITSDNAVEGVHYTIQDNKTELNYPAGQFIDSVVIIPIDNQEEDGDKIINFTIVSSSASIGYPGPVTSGTTMRLTLTDDDCAFTFEGLDGIAWIGNDNAPSNQGPNATQIVTLFDGANLLMQGISYGWLTGSYWDEVVVADAPVIVNMDPVTGEFTVDLQYLCDTTWLGSPQNPYSIEASGQFFSCLNLMVVNYNLYQGGAVLRSYTETIEF